MVEEGVILEHCHRVLCAEETSLTYAQSYNANGAIDVGDVLTVLSEFGCTSGCTADLTGDGFVAVDDILLVLSVFGVSCQ